MCHRGWVGFVFRWTRRKRVKIVITCMGFLLTLQICVKSNMDRTLPMYISSEGPALLTRCRVVAASKSHARNISDTVPLLIARMNMTARTFSGIRILLVTSSRVSTPFKSMKYWSRSVMPFHRLLDNSTLYLGAHFLTELGENRHRSHIFYFLRFKKWTWLTWHQGTK